MTTHRSFSRFGSAILAGLALLMLSTAAGCGSSPPELAADEEFGAVEPPAVPAVPEEGALPVAEEPEVPAPEDPVEETAEAAIPDVLEVVDEEPLPEIEGLTDLSELAEIEPDVVIIPPEELLLTARKALKAIETGPTKNKTERDLHDDAQVALEDLEKLFDNVEATTEDHQQAWDLKLKIEYLGIQRRWLGFKDRLTETSDRLWDSEFSTEAEYASSLVLKVKWFGPDVPVWQATEKLTDHAVQFPTGPTPVRMFLSYATELTRRRDYANARKVCNIALFNMKDHPEEAEIEAYLTKLESPNSRGVRVTAREDFNPIRRRKDAIQRQLESELKKMKPMLPLQLDPITRLDKVTIGWHSIKYSYTVTGATREILKKRPSIQKRVSQQLRANFSTQEMLQKGVQFNYRYFDTKGSLLFRFSISQ